MAAHKRIRWGVIGLGVGNQHALTLIEDANADLVAVCDRDSTTLEQVSAAYGDVAQFTNSDEMLATMDLDAVSVASYDWDHADAIVSCLERGIHVFAEKPLGMNAHDYQVIGRALNGDQRVRLTTNTLLRRSPRFVWLKNEIDRGYFGEIVHVQADYLYGRLSKLTHGWRGTNPEYSVTLGGTIHMVDLLLWLVGELPVVVTAVGSGAGLVDANSNESSVGYRGDTLRTGLLSFSSGLTASVSANFGSASPHFHRLDVYGTTGTFMNLPTASQHGPSTPSNTGLVLRGPDPGTAETVNLHYPAVPKGILIPEFNKALLQQGPTPITEQEAMDALAVCLALDESVRSARPVDIVYQEVLPRY